MRGAPSAPRRNDFRSAFIVALLAASLGCAPSPARADDDLPGRVGRIADVAGQLYLSPEDRATEWQGIGLNYPVSSGDNLWVSGDGRAEVDYGGGQFRLAGDTNLHVSRLDENQIALFIAQGRVTLRVRVLDPGDSARIDAPNTQIQLTRPGLYRIDVVRDQQSTAVTVREGEAVVLLANGSQQALPGQMAIVSGLILWQPMSSTARVRTASTRGARIATATTIGRAAMRTCRRRWSATPISIGTAHGKARPSTAPCGIRRTSRRVGRPTRTATGRASAASASPGSTPHRGATHRSTTVAGPGSAAAGAGVPARSSRAPSGPRRWSAGSGAQGGASRASRRAGVRMGTARLGRAASSMVAPLFLQLLGEVQPSLCSQRRRASDAPTRAVPQRRGPGCNERCRRADALGPAPGPRASGPGALAAIPVGAGACRRACGTVRAAAHSRAACGNARRAGAGIDLLPRVAPRPVWGRGRQRGRLRRVPRRSRRCLGSRCHARPVRHRRQRPPSRIACARPLCACRGAHAGLSAYAADRAPPPSGTMTRARPPQPSSGPEYAPQTQPAPLRRP